MVKYLWCFVLLDCVFSKSIVIHGGGTFLPSHFDKVVELGGGVGAARIGIITAAASTPVENGQWYVDQFMSYGAQEAYWIPVHPLNTTANSDPDVVANVERMTGVMFGAGDQARIITSLFLYDGSVRSDSPVMAAIRGVFANGGVMAGTSAGCAAMGVAPMIMGGMSYEALRYGAYEEDQSAGPDMLLYDEDGGVGMLEDYIPDSHFGERGREGRLMRLVSDTYLTHPNGVQGGIGVDENTALVITNAGETTAVGELVGPNGALILDLRQATLTSGVYWGIQNVYGHYLTNGDTITMSDLQLTPASWKTNLDGNEYYDDGIISIKIFNGNRDQPLQPPEFVSCSRSIFDARLDSFTYGMTEYGTPMRFQVDFFQEGTSVGYGGYSDLTEEWEISYNHLRIDVHECTVCE